MKKTKKCMAALVAAALTFTALQTPYLSERNIQAAQETEDFTIENGVLTKYNGPGGDVVIPDSVTSIGEYAFFWCKNLTSVTIPDSVTFIGSAAFQSCENLTGVTITDGMTSIGNCAFEDCNSLADISIPASVTSIGSAAFQNCESLTSITIPSSVTFIDDSTFRGCNSLANITVAEGNPVYDSRNGCNAIIETKSDTLIYGCKDTIIPASVTTIGPFAFAACSSLTGIIIPDSVMSIRYHAFSCSGLTDITIPFSVDYIQDSAFAGCKSLTDITILDGVSNIADSVFEGCSSLTGITIPSSVTYIGNYVFSACSSLADITVAEENPVYDSRNACNAIIETKSDTLIYGCKETVIPSSVTSIGDEAFNGYSGLTGITIPDSVTSIGFGAFQGCENLTDITIPPGLTYIGEYAFSCCDDYFKIYGQPGSYAESYAKDNNIAYRDIEGKAEPYAKGDLTGDGNVNLSDAQMALRIALAIDNDSGELIQRGDVDNDGTITLKDAQQILRAALGIIAVEWADGSKDAWDETVTESVYVCNGCDRTFGITKYGSSDNALDALVLHQFEDFYRGCGSYRTEKRTYIIHH